MLKLKMKFTIILVLIWAFLILTTLYLFLWNSQVPDLTLTWQKYNNLTRSSAMVCSVTEYNDAIVGGTEPKLILFHKFPDFYMLAPASGTHMFQSCPRECELTINSSRSTEADAVVYYSHFSIVSNINDVPLIKQPGQTWVFFSVESPPFSGNSRFGDPIWHKQFNWSMSYRHDSDFWHGYARTVQRIHPVEQELRIKNEKEWKTIFSKKTKLVAWFVSHCPTDSRREDYVSNLSKYIQVDIYGQCGSYKCKDHKRCLEMVRRDYKFYLSFENSLCKDYVTEKLKDPFDIGGVVPVVRGGADYQKLFPPNSLIDVSKFPSPKSLAEYLLTLANDEESYIKMLQWSWEYEVLGPSLPLCDLCQRLYEPRAVYCVYKNVYLWWTHRMCNRPTDL